MPATLHQPLCPRRYPWPVDAGQQAWYRLEELAQASWASLLLARLESRCASQWRRPASRVASMLSPLPASMSQASQMSWRWLGRTTMSRLASPSKAQTVR